MLSTLRFGRGRGYVLCTHLSLYASDWKLAGGSSNNKPTIVRTNGLPKQSSNLRYMWIITDVIRRDLSSAAASCRKVEQYSEVKYNKLER